MLCSPEIVISLHAHPALCVAADPHRETDGQVGGNCSATVDEAGKLDTGNTKLACCLGHRNRQFRQDILTNDFTGMWGGGNIRLIAFSATR